MTASKTTVAWGYSQIVLGVILLISTIAFLPVASKLGRLDDDLGRGVTKSSVALKGATEAFQKSFENVLPLTNDVVKIADKLDQASDKLEAAQGKVNDQRIKFDKWAKNSTFMLPAFSFEGIKPKVDWKDHDIGPLKEFFEDRSANCAEMEKTLEDFATISADISQALRNQSAILSDFAANGYRPALDTLEDIDSSLSDANDILGMHPITLGCVFVAALGFILSIMALFNGAILVSVGKGNDHV